MKILIVSDLISYGGASKLIFDLLQRMKARGHDCELLILTDKRSKYIDDLQEAGIPVDVVPESARGHLSKIRYIVGRIKRGGYDIVHANLFPTIYYCSMAKKFSGHDSPPLVMTEHSTDNRRRHRAYLRPLERYIYNNYDRIVSISDQTQEHLCRWLGTEKDPRFSVIENGIDVDAFMKAEPLSRKEICPDCRDGDILLLTVGSFTKQKNHTGLLDALALLPDNYRLILCGEGPLEEEIEKKIKKMGLSDRVTLLGFRKDIARIMHASDILVIPSLWEGFGLIAAEGMACGIPIAASDVPGLSDVVGEAGTRFDPANAEAMAAEILSLDEERRGYYSEKGRHKASQYDIDAAAGKYLELYRSMNGAENV